MKVKFWVGFISALLMTSLLFSAAQAAYLRVPLSALDQAAQNPEQYLPVQTIDLNKLQSRLDSLANQVGQGDPVQIEQNIGDFEGYFQNGWVEGEKYIPKEDPYCNGTATGQHPVAAKLADYFKTSYTEIMSWRCKGYRWGQIAAVYFLSGHTGKPVAEIFAMLDQGLRWREILVALNILPAVERTPVTPVGQTCPRPAEQAIANQMAVSLGVSVDDIVSWRCKGFGWAEISMAYAISKQAKAPVAEVFALRAAGKSWNEILQQYGLALPVPSIPDRPRNPLPIRPTRPARTP